MVKNILVPVDGSENSMRAILFAQELAKSVDGKLILLNIQPNYESINTKRFFTKKEMEEFTEQDAKETLEKIELTDEMNFEKKYRVGTPEIEICKEADEKKVFCIVMGTRGLGPIIGKILGSVSYNVIQKANCPVTIVP